MSRMDRRPPTRVRYGAISLTVFVLAGCETFAPTAEPIIASVPWLVGCWESEDGQSKGEWRSAGEQYMFGYGVTFKNGDAVFFEQERIEAHGDTISYFAYPMGGSPTRFDLAAVEAAQISFEAPDHDYPQRITYTATDTGVTAIISKLDGSETKQWAYRPCTRGTAQ